MLSEALNLLTVELGRSISCCKEMMFGCAPLVKYFRIAAIPLANSANVRL